MVVSTLHKNPKLDRDIPVPPLSCAEIAAEADALLDQYARTFGPISQPPIEIEDLVGNLVGLQILFDDLITRFHESMHAGLWMREREIWVDKSIDPRHFPENKLRYHFTLAHELGHWFLHRDIVLCSPSQRMLFGNDGGPEILRRSHGPRPLIERQADQFAGCLLMPEWLLRPAWRSLTGGEAAISDEELHEHLGDLDPSRFSQSEVADMRLVKTRLLREVFCGPLAQQFEVSEEAMRIQLEDLGLFVARHQLRLF